MTINGVGFLVKMREDRCSGTASRLAPYLCALHCHRLLIPGTPLHLTCSDLACASDTRKSTHSTCMFSLDQLVTYGDVVESTSR
jgi:hypothetical protein